MSVRNILVWFLVIWGAGVKAEEDPELWLNTPLFQLDGDGKLLKGQEEECVTVGEKGEVRVRYRLPPVMFIEPNDDNEYTYRKDGQLKSHKGRGQCTSEECSDRNGHSVLPFEYHLHDFYLKTVSIQGGQKLQEVTRHSRPEVVHRVIKTNKKSGMLYCPDSKGVSRVESWFEVAGLYAGKLLVLWLGEKVTEGVLRDFKGGAFSESLMPYAVLEAQVTFADQLKTLLENERNMNPGDSACTVAAFYAVTYYTFLSRLGKIDFNDLTTVQGFRTFWASAMAGTGLECADMKLVMPYVSEALFPSEGAYQSGGSQTISEIFKGPVNLVGLYYGQDYFFHPNAKGLGVKLGIKGIINFRNLLFKANQCFTPDYADLLQVLEDGVMMMASQPLPDSRGVINSLNDEYKKQVGGGLVGQLPFSQSHGANDQSGEVLVFIFESMLTGMVLESALDPVKAAAAPVLASAVRPATNLVQPIVGPPVAALSSCLKPVGYVAGQIGAAAAWTGSQAIRPVNYFCPGLVAALSTKIAGIVAKESSKAVLKGGGMGIALRTVGSKLISPAAAQFADYMVNQSTPDTIQRTLFESGRMVTIGYE
ncbi:hypothetical protein [Endozoicomonas arenosclerae]|uniref:hypothetical protein n=1 Tax=Endozoicomonas arenosclerae TaxID=1633495 RepID=UPI000784FC9F|nr:hypothetical protein [Endozoicomonas arenosclerae]